MPVILSAVGHGFTDRPLFSGVDARLDPGRVYSLSGPSGSGKSTLLGIIAGWTAPREGSVEHIDVTGIGWVFQNPYGVSRRTALDHVALPFLARGDRRLDAEARADDLLVQFGLGHTRDRAFSALSGGEAQRLMLARGIAAEPDLLLVDEPTAQLDVHAATTVNSVLGELARQGTIVVVATHDPRTRDACTDHLDLGRTT
ncbi:ATP-binding cassette domain-containing protein [Frigoribacterium sp. 2-23]|uniref:ATP-binding cassette domain-containing protein n=1 Tax=Frigoribacterium sp. 2-23 TaxID=3415006 RepID=UPI003C700D58